MYLENDVIYLRLYQEEDALMLYELAKDERIGLNAGWPAHQSIEESKNIIKTIFNNGYTYAICLKENNQLIGSIAFLINGSNNFEISDNEAELGYWIGYPYWNKGYASMALELMIDYGFNKLKFNSLWCGYFSFNEQSKRVQEKCGFRYESSIIDRYWPLIDKTYTVNITKLTKEEYEKTITVT